jgi:Calcineurin-like phosphoesterase
MAKAKARSSSNSSSMNSPGRFAHPFFTTTPPSERTPINGFTRMTDWSKQQLGPIPPVLRNGRIALTDVIGAAGVTEIDGVGEIRFHALGDSGVGMAQEAEQVSDEMAKDYQPDAGGLNPAFLLHLGDVIYGPDKETHYGDRFYRPYRHYPGKILAIPGNHDGEVRAAADSPSLNAFQANFCAAAATVPPPASGIGIFRETMTQPGVYWLLDAPFVRIIGLYSNLLENPGFLEGAGGDMSQLNWLTATLKAIAKIKDGKALIIATHHPPYSQSGHSGSTEMNQSISDACTAAGILPHAVLSAHAHNYQRYTRRIDGKQVLYVVAGGGGMPPQPVAPASGQPADASKEVTYDAALASLGYLFVTVSATQLKTEFWPQGQETTPFDAVTVDLSTQTIR